MALRDVKLEDKYDLGQRHVFVTGFQALVRLCLMQKELDRRNGLNTAGFVTGYRGSPLGGLDSQFLRAKPFLDKNDVRFQGGINEDLAATAIWGSQQAELRGEGKFDGVFGMWYGKGPGVDRTGDVFRHANSAGSAKHGGVLALMGDDHTAESSTTAHQSEYHFIDVMIPILNPAGVQEVLDYGLYGWAMSRFTGAWTALKTMHETIESTAAIDGSLERIKIVLPDDFRMPDGGLNIRLNDPILAQEARLHDYKRDAMLAFVRANKLNRIITSGGRSPKIGIITTGKSYLDVRQAFDELGIDEIKCNELGIRLFKVGCAWPLSRRELAEFADGLSLIIVVEEKRSLLEVQVREELYGTANQPVCIGKRDEQGNWLFPVKGALDPNDVAICIGERLLNFHRNDDIAGRVARLKELQRIAAETKDVAQRIPYFCSGCPHNSSTVVPEGMRAYAGIGCHYMAQWMDRSTLGYTHMGGEGANWVGQSHFTETEHVFQNLGDGTYYHSGTLAIRWAIASGVNITYKILYNDASAMTGGQPVEGHPTVPMITNQMHGEGVRRIAVVSDEPDKYPANIGFAPGTTIHHRDEMEALQIELRAYKGTSVLIYDQTCAAEKRRRRKRGKMPDPPRRLFINDLVCEGCGDCSKQSNCISVEPLETEFGRKRHINQSSCNKDFSCKEGFCPSFVTVEGGVPKKHKAQFDTQNGQDVNALVRDLPLPAPVALDKPYNLVVTGIGGTGVITVGALLGMAAHIEGKGCSVLDSIGLAQKNGSVLSYVRVGATPADIATARIPLGASDCLIGCDMVVAAGADCLAAIRKGRTRGVVNGNVTPPAAFVLNPDLDLDTAELSTRLNRWLGKDALRYIDAQELSTRLLGDGIGQNVMLMGAAYQMGLLPVGLEALDRAIAMNGVSIRLNREAFAWGRLAAHDLALVEKIAGLRPERHAPPAESLDEMVARRVAFLTDYQNAAYAARYRTLVDEARRAEQERLPGATAFSKAVARYAFKLMAYKDEYEVARLQIDPVFIAKLNAEFEEGYTLAFNLAPPIMAKPDPVSGEPTKKRFGPWMIPVFRLLARMKGLRGTAFDIFGYSEERKLERGLIVEYEARIRGMLGRLSSANYDAAVAIAELPEGIRGYGYVKRRHLAEVRAGEAALLAAFDEARAEVVAAE